MRQRQESNKIFLVLIMLASNIFIFSCGSERKTDGGDAGDVYDQVDNSQQEVNDLDGSERDELSPSSDTDGDTIDDTIEGRSSNRDTDGDTIPDYLDTDSDNDTIPDAEEGLTDPDGDHIPSYIDEDSDNDGVLDRDEVEAGTNPQNNDTDGDGASDLVEIVSDTDPLDSDDNPHARGNFVFIVPYNEEPIPDKDTLVFKTDIQIADVYFLLDTSASMQGELQNLIHTLTTSIVPEVRRRIPSTWFGAGIFDQCPAYNRCTTSGTPVGIRNLQSLAEDATLTQSALQGILGITCNGAHEPYIASLWLTATGDPSRWPRLQPKNCPNPDADVGYPCFRDNALPIIVMFGDEHFYNQSYQYDCANFPRFEEAMEELNRIHAKYIGIASSDGMWNSHGMQDTCVATDSVDVAGNPLAYRISSDGTGLGDQVITAIETLATQVPMKIGTASEDVNQGAWDTVDATIFIDRIVPNEAGGVADPRDSSVVCVGGLATVDENGDTVMDVFSSVLPGTPVCFDIYPKMNTSVQATEEPQLFEAVIRVIGNDVTPLDSRTVYFLVPPDTYSNPVQ